MEAKKWYLSKTLWTNLVMGVLVLVVPQIKAYVTPEAMASGFAVVNMILRVVTKTGLQLK